MTTAATPVEAEELAKTAVQGYLNACRMNDPDQVSNYLMKLCSVAGLLMACSKGSADAADRLHATALFVAKTAPKLPLKLAPIH